MPATTEWAESLRRWAIPEEFTRRTAETPWVLPRQMFARRADALIAEPSGATFTEARAALTEPGTVLDVGVAAGATSLPLAGRAPVEHVTGVDTDAELLSAFERRAAALGVPCRVVRGTWPRVAGQAEVADVVVCGNVVYNVADVEPFVRALAAHARRRVVVELAAAHPLTELNELWWRFHRLRRPDGPTAEDFLRVLEQLGIRAEVTRWRRPARAEYATAGELVDVTRRRLCLPPERAGDVEAALAGLGVDPAMPPDLGSSGRDLVTVSWAGSSRDR
ncbi:class I SAM-dependent methyltransferase [Amycolatopsis suaedae]|uniref:Class I SAM-dependent methyltransferase n=1 Tax=Amycolatopsis suaedae TaxID=2510978 RepID=A0A4Q7JA10_9PSEU|nr:class I SAM-dependent methyltransferase [Amycolatopsis suaedae]RZQ64630.1 class I SAM-dependent methyltransferase [Amycolatopsis suaedae]